ncbi:MAG: hypothetical protein U9Q83_01280 [Bacteroidota bacterium]|nr:hypothetical protein [Bacteroidota bacterium]
MVDFSKVKFSNLLTFDNVIFHDRINFIDTVFSVKSHTNYRGASVNFKKISVEEGAILEFRSTDKQNKIFQNDVLFSNETIKGQILFENVNFNRILKEGRARLLKLQNNYNVIIGKGCLKYRHQTKPKTLFVNSNNHALIAEIAETFANFFCEHNGLNLGFEIIEKDDNKITFFYFSDENITATQFNERLTKTEFDLWTMINNPEVVYNKHENNTNSPNISPDQSNEAVFINGFLYANELMINLMGMFFKISARIKHGKIGLDDLDSIFNSIHFGDRKLEIDSKIVYQTIINNYDQRRLISINKNNNIKVIGDNNAVLQDTTKSSIDITKYH